MYIRANKKHRSTISLSEPTGTDKDGNEITLMDILPSNGESVFAKVETDIIYKQVLEAIDKVLTPREKKIICYRYGINVQPLTQLQIAKEMKISRSYVSRIEKRAIEKLSKEFNS